MRVEKLYALKREMERVVEQLREEAQSETDARRSEWLDAGASFTSSWAERLGGVLEDAKNDPGPRRIEIQGPDD